MKFILNLFKTLSIIYWVLAASLFISLLFVPQVLDGAYEAYSNVAGQPTTSEVINGSSEGPTIDESSSDEETETTPVEESEEPVIEEETTETEEESDGEETSEPSDEEESDLPESQPLGMNPGSEEDPEEETTETEEEVTTEDEEEVVLEEELDEEEPIFELVPMTKEEFKTFLEETLLYSAVVMLPLTILIFKLSAAFNQAHKVEKIEVLEEVTAGETAGKKKAAKKAKVASSKKISVGLTGIKIEK
jgi:hypothetical protein